MRGPAGVGPFLVGLGVFVALIGLVVWTGALNWFGRLPGDIRYEGQSTRVYVPLVSMLLVSVVLSAISYVVRRFF